MSEEETLLEKLEAAREQNSEAFQNAPSGMNFQEFDEYMDKSQRKLSLASRKYRKIKTPTYSDIPTFGSVMSLKEFISCCRCGGFINYDGSGNYVKDGKMSDIDVYPSDVKNRCIRKDFDTIIWFNR